VHSIKSWLVCSALPLIIASFVTAVGFAADSKESQVGVQNTAEQSNVLIIGDSIAIGYTPRVKDMLTGVASVHRPDANSGDTRRGLKHLYRWLGDTQWDVIHFNWGLHNLCYRHPDSTASGHRDKINGTISVPLDEYKLNLEELVRQLKNTGAHLIWANTTIVPDGEAGRVLGDELKYNRAAAEIMERHEITVDDLHTLTSKFDQLLFIGPGNVHYTDEGYAVIAAQVAEQIRVALVQE
jgi:lysophospholipase L1-like esterase